MPPRGVSKKTDRACLVCAGATRVAFLGIDVCRACAVFYRRADKRNVFACRSGGSGQCTIGKGINCKRCRFEHIVRLLERSGMSNQRIRDIETPASHLADHQVRAFADQESEAGSSNSCSIDAPQLAELPILERLKTHYRTMSWTRLNTELFKRPNPPHPLEISLEKGPFFPASCSPLNVANQVLLSCLLEFGACAFPEFGSLGRKDQWDIVLNAFYRLRIFEGIYRASVVYPDDLDKTFIGYSTWVSVHIMNDFYKDSPGDIEGARKHLKHSTIQVAEIRKARELVARVSPRHEEFLVVLALMFWELGDLPVGEAAAQLGEAYREAVLKELNVFYRQQMGLEDYAARLGELLLFLQVFDRTKDMKEHFEMLNLLGVIPDDNFTFRLQRD